MPRDKDLKRLIRARMTKTGESYTAARARILEKTDRKAAKASVPERAPDYAGIARMSDEKVKEKTGRTWAEWVAVLDGHGANTMLHGDIARIVHEQYEIPGWWSQTVTVGYERIHGLREVGQRRDGHYEAGRSRTYPVSMDVLFAAWADPAKRRRWLREGKLRSRRTGQTRSLRFAWPDGTLVVAYFTAKGDAKSSVAVQHMNLPDRETVDAMKAYWSDHLAALGTLLRAK